MIYKISGNYYVKVGSKYVKLSMSLDKNGELVMAPTKEKIENNKNLVVKEIDLQKERQSIIKSLKPRYYNRDES